MVLPEMPNARVALALGKSSVEYEVPSNRKPCTTLEASTYWPTMLFPSMPHGDVLLTPRGWSNDV